MPAGSFGGPGEAPNTIGTIAGTTPATASVAVVEVEALADAPGMASTVDIICAITVVFEGSCSAASPKEACAPASIGPLSRLSSSATFNYQARRQAHWLCKSLKREPQGLHPWVYTEETASRVLAVYFH